jgi:hypothetical protein
VSRPSGRAASLVYRTARAWSTGSSANASGGTTRYSSLTGASATYESTGRAVSLVAPTGPTRGRARVYVDGTLSGNIDLHSSRSTQRKIVWQRTWPTSDPHVIRFVVEGTPGHPRFESDALIYDR